MMPRIDLSTCRRETFPYLLALLGHLGSHLFPQRVQLLQLAESTHNIRLFQQIFSLLAKLQLCLKILLEVQIAEIAVDLDVVIKTPNSGIVRHVQIFLIRLRHKPNLIPLFT